MTTPIPRILLALDGKIEFTNRSNPFGSGDSNGGVERGEPGGPGWKKPPPETTAEKIKAVLGARARKTPK